MNNALENLRNFRHSNYEYYDFCQNQTQDILQELIKLQPQYAPILEKFHTELKPLRDQAVKIAEDLQKIQTEIKALFEKEKTIAQEFEKIAAQIGSKEKQLKAESEFSPLNKLEVEIKNILEKRLQDPSNKFHQAYVKEMELLKEYKNTHAHDDHAGHNHK